MRHRTSGRTARCCAVWLASSGATSVALLPARGPLRETASTRGQQPFEDLLVSACAAALVLALAWLWCLTTVTVWQVVADRPPRRAGATRRLVLLACGAALVTGTAAPSAFADETHRSGLAGLPMPDRAVSESRPHDPAHRIAPTPPDGPAAPRTHVVRRGDSLWSIASARPVPGQSVEQRWRAIWAANARLIGPDPDLIRPGQRFVLPDGDQAPSVPQPDRPHE